MPAPDWNSTRIALSRFGFGARGAGAGDLRDASRDPRGFVRADVAPQTATLDEPELASSPVLLRQLFAYQEERKAERVAKVAAPPTGMSPPPAQPPEPNIAQQTFRAEAQAKLARACAAPVGLSERLVGFWSNHFTVSAAKSPFTRMCVGAFEREAIRPHIYGRFADMLRAVEQHPAMLHYLDNQLSIGPDSPAGQRRQAGLNENLAREALELHSLGVGGGYSQADVTSLARILTGWTIAGREGLLGEPGTFVFAPRFHQPGPQRLLGAPYPDAGLGQGEAALADIARHPSTARHIATKLARHFVADHPPPMLVERLRLTFVKCDGDLRATTLALLDADEAWSAPLTKMRDPTQFLVAAIRLIGRAPERPERTLGALRLMGQPLWTAPAPNGWPDDNAAWASPEGVKLRLDVAAQMAQQLAGGPNPSALLDEAFGEAASEETRATVARAETRQQGLALLLMSPEMQRR